MYKIEKFLDKLFGEASLTRATKKMYAQNDAEVALVKLPSDVFGDLV